MIRPYNPAPLPTIPTQAPPSTADHFTKMLAPIVQMQQMKQQHEMQQQQMAMQQQQMQIQDFKHQRAMRKDEREMRMEQVEDDLSNWFQEQYSSGVIPNTSMVAEQAAALGASPDMVLELNRRGRQEALESLAVAREIGNVSEQQAHMLSAVLSSTLGYDIDPAVLQHSINTKRETLQTKDGRLIQIETTPDGLKLTDSVDTLSPETRAAQEKQQSLSLEAARLNLDKLRQQIGMNNLKIQQMLNPPAGAVIGYKDFVGLAKNIQSENARYRSLYEETYKDSFKDEKFMAEREALGRQLQTQRESLLRALNNELNSGTITPEQHSMIHSMARAVGETSSSDRNRFRDNITPQQETPERSLTQAAASDARSLASRVWQMRPGSTPPGTKISIEDLNTMRLSPQELLKVVSDAPPQQYNQEELEEIMNIFKRQTGGR